MTEVQGTINPIRVVSVAQQGPAGPPGPDGPGFTSRMGNYFYLAPINIEIPLITDAPFEVPIRELRSLQVTSGGLTLSLRINGVDVPGLSDLSVTPSPQSPAADDPDLVVPIGGSLSVVQSAVEAGTSRLQFTLF